MDAQKDNSNQVLLAYVMTVHSIKDNRMEDHFVLQIHALDNKLSKKMVSVSHVHQVNNLIQQRKTVLKLTHKHPLL